MTSAPKRSSSLVHLEVRFHESEEPPWAEWEMWRNTLDADGREAASTWIATGTSPSLESAIDKAYESWREDDGGL